MINSTLDASSHRLTVSVVLLFVAVLYPRVLPSQVGAIKGVVADSLYQTSLSGANVILEGQAKSAIVASDGTFTIDSVSPGRLRLIVYHPLLDLAGISLVTPPISIIPGQTVSVLLATPSPGTLLRLKCAQDSGAGILGRAGTNSQSDQNRQIHLTWLETIVSRASINVTKRQNVATVDRDGSFKFCNLPRDLEAVLSADTMSAATVGDTINFKVSPLALVDLSSNPERLDVSRTSKGEETQLASANRPTSGRVRGRVVDTDAKPVVGAIVTTADGGKTESDSIGRFEIRTDKTGPQHISIKKLGMAEMAVPVFVVSNEPTEIVVEMSRSAPTLAPVTIRERYDAAESRIGFDSRRQRRPGSFFISPAEMDRLSAVPSLPQLLSRAPNLRYVDGRIVGRPRGYNIHMTELRTCVNYMVDGRPGQQETVIPADVGAIEVYKADDVPQDIARFLNTLPPSRGCEVVFIWTRVYLGIR